MNGAFIPACPRCEWEGAAAATMLVALARATEHMDQEHPHDAVPEERTQLYPDGWDGADVPDWIVANCAKCGRTIDWDARNLWSHT